MNSYEEQATTINRFSGTYEEYLDVMEASIRNIVENQVNLTIKIFDEAKQIKNNIIEKGGSEEDANLAYLEYILISKESLENFGVNNEESQNEITSNGEDITIQSKISGIKTIVSGNATMISITVDGIMAEYWIDENNNLQTNNLEN
ncbi:hypothetical protein BG20_I1360 [Candidatus Nitrosarchaeum limnium BG20]|uniref:Uncharacterized protein n=2 Tax=Nitrosarchaeum TaxID=1007082 RepID=S2E5C8_9ARCH|nr:hypothetical protein BG20_I1360 [Candidatus Nitrosarchaeum limnium BG20]